jgi:NNP family nitrate/nitrite transporter-like MFS transporter
MGGGVAVLVMPALVEGLARWVPEYLAWRWALFLPGGLQVLCGVLVMAATDDGPAGGSRWDWPRQRWEAGRQA